jgi:hypothetical protein
MAYWLDDGFDTWPETIRAGTAAAGLYTRCGAWIARNLTDGFVPAELATSYGTREWITKLLDAGLWKAEGDGYRDVYYLVSKDGTKLNPPAEKVSERKAAKAERQRRWLERRSETRETRKSRGTNASKDASRDAPRDMPPALPPSKEGTGVRARGGAAHGTPTPNDKSKSNDASEDASNPHWSTLPAYGTPRDPAVADRATRGAAAARQQLGNRQHLAGLAGGPRCDQHPGQPAATCSICEES